MSERLNQSRSSSQTNKKPTRQKPNVGIVVDVILDETHPRLRDAQPDDSTFSEKETTLIPAAVIRPAHDQVTTDADLFIYRPHSQNDIDVPLVGETVEIVKVGNNNFYRRINSAFLNVGNARENKNKGIFPTTTKKSNSASDYKNSSQTGITNSNISERDSALGKYFTKQQVNKLIFFEGDKVIQSRFGQSIRFSGFNNESRDYAPTTIIRNRQNDESLASLKEGQLVEEDINKDGTIIALTSGNYKLNFQPGRIDDGGNSNFETTPSNFVLPNEYVGTDQLLLNSGRIILSSKDSEMIFFSKKDYGFISDGKFIIDNGVDGAEMDFNGDVNIRTNNNSFSVNTDQGTILLNTSTEEQPLVRGQALVDILSELIDLLNKQIFNTPSGPTASGPNNKADFNALKAKLEGIKSTLNYTQ